MHSRPGRANQRWDCRRFTLLLGALIVVGSTTAQTPAPVTEATASAAPKLRLDTAAYRSAVALTAGKVSSEPVPAESGARTALLNERGLWLLRLEQWKLAEQDFFAVLQKEPKNVTARAGVAWANLKLGRGEAAKSRLDELQQEFPDAFAVASESKEIRAAALGRIADHVFWRQKSGSLVAADVAESPYNFGAFQLDALLEDAESAFDNGSIDLAEEHLQAIAALGAPDLPALRRLRSQIAAARTQIAQLEPGAPDFASTRYLVEKRVAQVQRLPGTSDVKAGQSNAFLATRSTAFALATTELGRPTINARRRLLARWLALRAGAEKPTELEFVRDDLSLAARFFASMPNEGDTASATLAAENLARLRQIAPNWPLSEVVFLPTAWPDGPLLKVIEEITGGAPLTPGDPRLKKAIELWQIQLEPFSVDIALDTAEDALRLGDHYRIGAALAVFELQTLPEHDTPRRAEATARIDHLVRLSNLCADYAPPAASVSDAGTAADTDLAGKLHAHFNSWEPAHRGTPKAKELEPIFTQLSAQAWVVREYLRGAAHQADVLPWRQVRRTLEARYASYVSPTQIHDRPLLFVVAQLRRKAGDLAGTLDVLPLLEQRTQLGTEVENLQVPAKPDAAVYETELSAFVRSLRGASPAATAYADITAWIEEVNRTRRAPPLPEVAPELRANPAVALQWTWAQTIRGHVDDPPELLRPAEKNAGASASFALVAPELKLRVIAQKIQPLYDRGRKVWAAGRTHAEDFDPPTYQKNVEECSALMRQLLALKADPQWKSLKGGDLLEFRLAFSAGDFASAAQTEAGARGERYLLHAARAEAAAYAGMQALTAGKIDEARAKLAQADAFEMVPYPGDRTRDDSIEDGEYVLILRALLGYRDMDGIRVKGRDVVGYFDEALKVTTLPAHVATYRKIETELRWRAQYLDNREMGRTHIARYLRGVLFEKAERDLAFERAHFLDPDVVKGLTETTWIDLHQFKEELTYYMPPPPVWDGGKRVTTEYVENPAYFEHHGSVLAAIARKDFEAVQRLGQIPKTIAVQREHVVNEPPFWGYYRTLYRGLKR